MQVLVNEFLSWPNSDLGEHFSGGVIVQPNAQNTYETHMGSGVDGFLYIDNYNITTQESARFQF